MKSLTTFILIITSLTVAFGQTFQEDIYRIKSDVDTKISKHTASIDNNQTSRLKSDNYTVKLDSIVDSKYNGTTKKWITQQSISYKTDANNRVTEAIVYNIEQKNTMLEYMKLNYTYNNDNEMTSGAISAKEANGSWSKLVDITSTYKNGKVEKLEWLWNFKYENKVIRYNSKEEYTYHDAQNLTVVLKTQNESIGGEYTPDELDSIWITDDGYDLKDVHYEYSDIEGELVGDTMAIIEYDSDEMPTQQIVYNYKNGSWSESVKKVPEFDQNNEAAVKTYEYHKNGNSWDLEYMILFTHSDFSFAEDYQIIVGTEIINADNDTEKLNTMRERKKVGMDENDLSDFERTINYISQVDLSTEIPTNSKISQSIFIGPNPAKDFITLSATKDSALASIRNIHGKTVLVQSFANDEIIDISSLPSGLYVLKLTTSADTQTVSFIKE